MMRAVLTLVMVVGIPLVNMSEPRLWQQKPQNFLETVESHPTFNLLTKKNGIFSLKYLEKGGGYSISEKVIAAGFDFETHKVHTVDGYINEVWRIPRKSGESANIDRKPVILQHGLLDDSYTFFALKQDSCLPIILAEKGYDVWVPNSRGNIFSTEHENRDYDPSSFFSNYWNFTFHEMAKYDVPANIDYVKRITGYEKVDYIGHSQGSFTFFLAILNDPDYINRNIASFSAIGTVVTIFYIVSRFLKSRILGL